TAHPPPVRGAEVVIPKDGETLRRAILIRLFEEKLLALFSEGKLSGTVHTCIGQELSALAVAAALREGDWIFSNHRCHGHYLAWTGDARGLLAEIMGLPSGICAGRGGSQHICRDRFLSNGVQGGGVPIAAGCAAALKIAEPGRIATSFIGDGTLGQGVVYETLNLASRWSLPLLVVLEKNGYAQSTATATTIAGSVRGRFEAFGVKCFEATIWDRETLFATAREAAEYVRRERVPAALSVECFRLKAHSKGDDNRSPELIAEFAARDPLHVFEREFPESYARMRIECEIRLRDILAELERSPAPIRETLGAAPEPARVWKPAALIPEIPSVRSQPRVVERVRDGLRHLLANDPRVILIGEDMEDPYGGAFKATKGLSTDFPGRVRNTPISEAAITGVGNGLALAGMRPFVEIMFGDFITLAADQIINQASKFAYMYAGQVAVPVVVRAAMGGKRGYGATHSQCLERHFFGTPGLNIVALNSVCDPALLLHRIHERLDEPCLLLENKLLYGMSVRSHSPDGRVWLENGADFPTLKLDAHGRGDVTVVTYGGMVDEVEEAVRRAFEDDEIIGEVLVPTRVFPLDVAPIVESVARTGRLLVVEEGQGFAGFGSEVLAACAERLPGAGLRTARVCAEPHPIPCSRELEKFALPGVDEVLAALQKLARA
ncbi:MAG TPA: thiamine pyrophosphate-dependent enzyme, partial [Chthoniobacteraceae bacterium]|nr:thiamine pyrophosphate-dependent enzyme [Chthoniobacteraceae bacterium]